MGDEKTIQEILHDFRKKIDACIKEANQLRQANTSAGREISLAHTKLQEGKMWIGKALEALGSELPAEYRDEAGTETKPEPTPDPGDDTDNVKEPEPKGADEGEKVEPANDESPKTEEETAPADDEPKPEPASGNEPKAEVEG